MALQQIAQINALLTEADRVNMRKSFGLRKDYNPLLCIPTDLYLSIPVEFCTPYYLVLVHTSVMGKRKYFLHFPRIAHFDFFKPVLLDEWKSVVKLFMVKFGPCSSFSAERFESFISNVRMYNVFGNRLAPSRDIAKRFCTLQHLCHICHGGNASERCGVVEDTPCLLATPSEPAPDKTAQWDGATMPSEQMLSSARHSEGTAGKKGHQRRQSDVSTRYPGDVPPDSDGSLTLPRNTRGPGAELVNVCTLARNSFCLVPAQKAVNLFQKTISYQRAVLPASTSAADVSLVPTIPFSSPVVASLEEVCSSGNMVVPTPISLVAGGSAVDESLAASGQELKQALAQEAGVLVVPDKLEPLDDNIPVVPELPLDDNVRVVQLVIRRLPPLRRCLKEVQGASGIQFGYATLDKYVQEAQLLEEMLKTSKTVLGTQQLHRIVLVAYNGSCYLDCVLNVDNEGRTITITFLHPCIPAKSFVYPKREDVRYGHFNTSQSNNRTYRLSKKEMDEASHVLMTRCV
eukprot:Em0016g831a